MPRKQKKYHFIYRTTNLINNKFYVGMHSTNNLEDGYFGSGKRLGYSIRKYGLENHEFEILEFLPSREELKKREAEAVNEELLADPLCMNLKFGGEGGWDHVHSSRANLNSEKWKAYSESAAYRENSQKGLSIIQSRTNEEKSQSAKKNWETGRDKMMASVPEKVSKMNSAGAKEKRKETFAKNKHQSGEFNSQFGTCWIHKEDQAKKIKKEDLQNWINLGWLRGRK